jgi:gliding motility-associated-like protein
MKKLFLYFHIILFLFFGIEQTFGQNPDNVLIHNIVYETNDQDMWGPGGAFSLDFDLDLIDIEWNESDTIGQYTQIFGEPVGIGLSYGFWGVIRSTFSIHGFTTGWVDINYPVEITLDFPDDYSFDHGETITINSWYDVLDGWYLNTHFPEAGVIALDLEYGFGIHMDIILELFGTQTIPLIPTINIPEEPVPGEPLPHDSIAIFYLNGDTGEVVYPCIDPVTGFIDFCEDTILPIIIEDWFDIGLTGEIDLPFVETEDWLDETTNCLHAYGQDHWVHFNLDILTFLAAIANLIPPPTGPQIVEVIDILQGGTISYDMPPITANIEYYILQASLDMNSWMTQEFAFCPDILAILGFPLAVDYTETDPNDGDAIINAGTDSIIPLTVGNDLNFTYPCFDWDDMDITVDYDILPNFTNHTWDSLTFSVLYSVVWASIEIVLETPWKASEIPEFAIPVTYTDPKTGRIIHTNFQSPAYSTPEIDLSDYLAKDEYISLYDSTKNGTKDITIGPIEIGPLLEGDIPLGYLPINWFEETWYMDGFYEDDDHVHDEVNIIPLPELDYEIDGNDILCFGDTTGVITVTAINSTGPYTFEYSNGVTNTHMSPIDSIVVPAGYYYVTISDVYGCSLIGEMNVSNLYPPMWADISADDVLCHGEPTGNLYANSGGGAGNHTYWWEPSNSEEQNPEGVYAGWHYITITDDVGCTIEDSVFVDQPDAPVSMTYTFINVSCHGGSDGQLDVTVAGGTPPYAYEWSNGFQVEDLFDIPAGDYTLTITDANGCELSHTMVIIEPDPLIAHLTSNDVSCHGFADGNIDLSVSGGTPPYSYQWNTGSTSEDLNDLESGVYIVTVVDNNDCQTIAYVYVDEPDFDLTATITHEDIRCHGEDNGYAIVEPFGGTPPYFYQWSNGQIGQSIDSLPPGTYTVTILDDHACSAVASVDITQPEEPLSAIISATDATCGNYTDGSVHVTASGGTAPYHYAWNNESWAEDLINVGAGYYEVTITDDHYCHFVIGDTVYQPEPINIITLGDQTICDGQTAIIGYSMITGGVPPYDVYWTHHGLSGDTIEVAPEGTTTYGAFVVDATNCISDTSHFTVTVYEPLEFSVTANRDTVCPFDSVRFVLNMQGGGDEPYEVYMNDSLIEGEIAYVNPFRDSVYSFTLWDACHFDSIYIEYPISVYPLPPVLINANVTEGCQPLTVFFNEGSPDMGQRYVWNFDDGDIENLSFDKQPTHTFYNATTYHVNLLVESADGCFRDSTLPITVHPTPDAQFEASETNVTLTDPLIEFTNYSDGAYFYEWNFGDGTITDQLNPYHSYSEPGRYEVILTAESLFGCIDTAMVEVKVSGSVMVYAPTAFTPNSDETNETFGIVLNGVDTRTYYLEIYNRWGELLYVTDDMEENWDGTTNHLPAPEGVYSWYLEFEDFYGNKYTHSGKFTLIR